MKKLFYVLFFFTQAIIAQVNYLLPNEEMLVSFETVKGKKVMLAKDKNDKYIIYRYGTKTKIELEYPEKNKESWKKFKFSSYMRGGGTANEGMDLNYLAFTNKDVKYVIYYTYTARESMTEVGVKILNPKTDAVIGNVKGIEKTWKGSLIDFRDNKLIGVDDDNMLYD